MGQRSRSHLRLVSSASDLTAAAETCAAELDAIRSGPPAPLRVSACAGAIEHLAADWERRRRPEDEAWRLPGPWFTSDSFADFQSVPESETRGALRARIRAALLARLSLPRDPWSADARPLEDWRHPKPPWQRVNLYVLGAKAWTPQLDALVRAQAERATKTVLVGVAAGTRPLAAALSELRDLRGWLEELGRLRALSESKGRNE